MTPRALTARMYRRIWRVMPPGVQFVLDGAEAAIRGKPELVRHFDLIVGLIRRRLRPGRLFVGWLFQGDANCGATRVRGLPPHAYFRRHGVNSVILHMPRTPRLLDELRPEDVSRIVRARFDVVIFQGVIGSGAEMLARALQAVGTRTVYTTGDLVMSGMPEVVDWIAVASGDLAKVAPRSSDKTSVIEAVIDAPPGLVKDYSRQPVRDDVRVVWVGYPENLHLLGPVTGALADPRLSRFRLITISRGPGVTFQWDLKRVWQQLLDCDIAVLPSAPLDSYQAKPNTRMTMFKALGLPIVASPIPSYLETLSHGRSCYFARDVTEWADCLAALADVEHRREIGLADRDRILATYGVEAIGRRYLSLCEGLVSRPMRSGDVAGKQVPLGMVPTDRPR